MRLLTPHIHKVNLLTLPLQQGLALSRHTGHFHLVWFHGSVHLRGLYERIRRLRWVFFMTGSAISLVAIFYGSSPRWEVSTRRDIPEGLHWPAMPRVKWLAAGAPESVVASRMCRTGGPPVRRPGAGDLFSGRSAKLFDCTADLFQQRRVRCPGRLQTGLITFLPPLAFALSTTRGFVALGYTGVALRRCGTAHPAMLGLAMPRKPQGPPGGIILSCGRRHASAGAGVYLRHCRDWRPEFFDIALGFLPDRGLTPGKRLPGGRRQGFV